MSSRSSSRRSASSRRNSDTTIQSPHDAHDEIDTPQPYQSLSEVAAQLDSRDGVLVQHPSPPLSPQKPARQQYTLMDQLSGFPYWQMFVIMTVRFSEPVSMTSLFPYVYFMVKHLRPEGTEASISRYAGYISGSFALCQALTGVHWGRYSDKYGRKPILLMGMLGTCISLFWFGTTQSYHMAMIARCLGGVLNGNVGVIRTAIGEIAPKRRHQALAMSTMSLLWQLGCVVGPIIGGSLADPLANHPDWFPDENSRWRKLAAKCPFLLPNVVTSSMLLMSLILAFLFLEESHPDYLSRNYYDPGLIVGDTIVRAFTFGKFSPTAARRRRIEQLEEEERAMEEAAAAASAASLTPVDSKDSNSKQANESTSLLQRVDDTLEEDMEYISGQFTNHSHTQHHIPTDAAPNYGALEEQPPVSPTAPSINKEDRAANGTFFEALTPAVLATMSMYFMIALQTVVFDEMMPLMASTPPARDPETGAPSSKMPFHFVGGLGLTSVQVGNLLSLTGLLGTFLVMFYFPYVDGKYGTYGPFCLVNKIFPVTHFFMPYVLLLVGEEPPRSMPAGAARVVAYVQEVSHGFTHSMWALLVIMMFKTLLMAIAFPAVMLLINRAIPNRKHTGGINGLSQMFAASARAIGPILWGLIMTKGQEWEIAELPWWLLSVFCLGAFGLIKVLDRYRHVFEQDD